MATDTNPTPPDGATDVVEQPDDDQFALSPGEDIIGKILTMRAVETEFPDGGTGQSGILTLELEDGDVVDYFAKGEAKRAFNDDRLERGSTYWIAKMAEVEEVQGTEYNPTKLKKIE